MSYKNLMKFLREAGAQVDGESKYTIPASGLKAVDVVFRVHLGEIHMPGSEDELQVEIIVPSVGGDTGGKIGVPASQLRLLSEEKYKP